MQRRTFLLGAVGACMLLLGAGALLVSMAQQATAPAAKVVPKGKITLAWHAGRHRAGWTPGA